MCSYYMVWAGAQDMKLVMIANDIFIPLSYWSKLPCLCWAAGSLAHPLPQPLHELTGTWSTQRSPADHHHSNHTWKEIQKVQTIGGSFTNYIMFFQKHLP
jgi:hypothetical protein